MNLTQGFRVLTMRGRSECMHRFRTGSSSKTKLEGVEQFIPGSSSVSLQDRRVQDRGADERRVRTWESLAPGKRCCRSISSY